MSSEEELCALDIEIQSLKAIFAEELEVERDEDNGGAVKSLVVQMSPELSKGENVQFVRFEIVFNIPTKYPQTVPQIELRNVRGLSEETQSRTKEHMIKRADELVGNAMLFELIQVAKEQLTSSNTPSIPCSICLFSFHAEDPFSRTPCFHYFHTHCLAKHVQHTLAMQNQAEDNAPQDDKESQEVFCPVCRLAIPFSESDPDKFPAPRESLVEEQGEYLLSPELKEMQEKMAALYSQQQAKGSIIDLEAEKNKFFIEISNTPDIQVLPATAVTPSSTKKRYDGASSKASPDGMPEKHSDTRTNLRKFVSPQSRNSDKTPAKDQRRSKPSSDNQEISQVSDWSQEIEQSSDTTSKKNNEEGNLNSTEGEGWEAEDSAGRQNPRGDGETWRPRSDNRGDKWIRKRKPFERKPRPQKESSNENADGNNDDEKRDLTKTSKDSKQENIEDESVTQDQLENRMYKKKKFRKPRNTEAVKDPATGETASAVGEPGEAESPDHKTGDEPAQAKPDYKENLRNRPGYQKPPYRNRENDDNDFDNQQRYRKQNNKYNRPWTKRYNRDRPEYSESQGETINEHSKVDGEVTSSAPVEQEQADDKLAESQPRDTGYRNSRNWYKNKVPGKPRDPREKFGSYKKNDNYGRSNFEQNDAPEGSENVEEQGRRAYPRQQFRGRYKGSRDRFAQHDSQPNVTHKVEDGGFEEASQNVESDSESKAQQNENKKFGYAKNNRRFQKSSSHDSETAEDDRDVDRGARDYNNRYGRNRYPTYKNRQNFRRNDPAPLNNDEPSVVPESKAEDSNNNDQVSNTHFDRHRRNPRYRNDSSDLPKEEQGDHGDIRDSENQEEAASNRNVSRYGDRGADFQEDNTGRKPWSDSRTNWKENRYSRSGYNRNDRNRYQKYHGQQSYREKLSELSDVATKNTAAGSKNEQSSTKQHIQPFTHLSHNFVTDAPPPVSIPPPFSKSSML